MRYGLTDQYERIRTLKGESVRPGEIPGLLLFTL
jgi:hypothetical protein